MRRKTRNMIEPMEKLSFQYRDLQQGYRIVAFNAPLEYFATKVKQGPNGPVAFLEEMTVKDCRHIDNTVYFMKGRVPDNVICRMIDLYNKVKDNGKWKQVEQENNNGIIL